MMIFLSQWDEKDAINFGPDSVLSCHVSVTFTGDSGLIITQITYLTH